MDLTTLIGIVTGTILVLVAIFMGGGLGIFMNPAAMMITVGGTMAATLISFSLKEVKGVMGVVRKAFFHKNQNIPDIIKMMLKFALKARREGILALESEVEKVDDPFVIKSLQLAIDGTSPEVIEDVLRTELSYIEERHTLGQDIFKTMGTMAPAFGLIGTLIGLVQMLKGMEDVSTIGPSMAVALLTTFYGALMANLVCMPIAGKLKVRSKEELLRKEVIISGILSIQSGDNPRIVEQKLQVYISPSERSDSLEEAKGAKQAAAA